MYVFSTLSPWTKCMKKIFQWLKFWWILNNFLLFFFKVYLWCCLKVCFVVLGKKWINVFKVIVVWLCYFLMMRKCCSLTFNNRLRIKEKMFRFLSFLNLNFFEWELKTLRILDFGLKWYPNAHDQICDIFFLLALSILLFEVHLQS